MRNPEIVWMRDPRVGSKKAHAFSRYPDFLAALSNCGLRRGRSWKRSGRGRCRRCTKYVQQHRYDA